MENEDHQRRLRIYQRYVLIMYRSCLLIHIFIIITVLYDVIRYYRPQHLYSQVLKYIVLFIFGWNEIVLTYQAFVLMFQRPRILAQEEHALLTLLIFGFAIILISRIVPRTTYKHNILLQCGILDTLIMCLTYILHMDMIDSITIMDIEMPGTRIQDEQEDTNPLLEHDEQDH